jgi:hypothetical protein
MAIKRYTFCLWKHCVKIIKNILINYLVVNLRGVSTNKKYYMNIYVNS